MVGVVGVTDTLVSFVTSAGVEGEALAEVTGVNPITACRVSDDNGFVILERERDLYGLIVVHGTTLRVGDFQDDATTDDIVPSEVCAEGVLESFIHSVGGEVPSVDTVHVPAEPSQAGEGVEDVRPAVVEGDRDARTGGLRCCPSQGLGF